MTPATAPRVRRVARPLRPAFYRRNADVVARELLGAILEHRTPQGLTAGRIVETEAYLGPHDPACHAAAGITPRTRVLYGPPGVAYVYFVYGMHWCVNAVTREEGYGSAVLIRAIEPTKGIDLMRRRRRGRPDRHLADGPAKVCEALAIDGSLNGVRLDRGELRILRGTEVPDPAVSITPRIGIRKAADWPLRFVVSENPRGVTETDSVTPRADTR